MDFLLLLSASAAAVTVLFLSPGRRSCALARIASRFGRRAYPTSTDWHCGLRHGTDGAFLILGSSLLATAEPTQGGAVPATLKTETGGARWRRKGARRRSLTGRSQARQPVVPPSLAVQAQPPRQGQSRGCRRAAR